MRTSKMEIVLHILHSYLHVECEYIVQLTATFVSLFSFTVGTLASTKTVSVVFSTASFAQ